MRQGALLIAMVPGVVATTSVAYGQSVARHCVDSHETVQLRRKGGDLLSARDAARICAREDCPQAVKAECLTFVQELDRDVPSVTLSVVDAHGQPWIDAIVLIDGKMVAERVDGKSIDTNPGARTLRVIPKGREAVDISVVVKQGAKNQPVEVKLPPGSDTTPLVPADEPEPLEPARNIPAAAWISGGVGIAGLAMFGAFAGIGWSERSDLEACGTRCGDELVQPVRTKLLIADTALGVGIASLALSAVLLIAADDPDPEQEEPGDVSVAATPTDGGACGAVEVRF